MNRSKNKIIAWVVILGVAGLGVFLLVAPQYAPGELDSLAQCLEEKGATFYGAFWCPVCQNQKNMFGNSARLLPYVECSTPDSRGQLPICQEKEVSGYPTWEFADGSRLTGAIPPETLAEKTGCPLRQVEDEASQLNQGPSLETGETDGETGEIPPQS